MILNAGFSRPEPEELELMFEQLAINEKIELINPQDIFKLEYMDTEFIYVSLYDNNSYLLAKKKGSLIGAINYYDGETKIVLPKDIQPQLLCVLISFFVWGQSSISIVACPLVPLAHILYPDDQELHDALFRACLNGVLGIEFSLIYAYRFCY